MIFLAKVALGQDKRRPGTKQIEKFHVQQLPLCMTMAKFNNNGAHPGREGFETTVN
jgi:hypothetical protein